MRRKLIAFASLISFLLCLATSVLWVRSYEQEDVIIRRRGSVPFTWQTEPKFGSFGGGVGFGPYVGFAPRNRKSSQKTNPRRIVLLFGIFEGAGPMAHLV